MSDKREVIPIGKNDSGPKLIDPAATATRLLGYAIVDGIKFLYKESGEAIEFGAALIIQNDGSRKKTKKNR